MESETIFELRGVSYSYLGKIDALKGVSLKICRGEQIAIMGANGSGKSTLLAILDALIYPTSGKFYAFGREVTEDIFDSVKKDDFRSYFRKRVGFVFQNSDVQLFSPTVYDEVAFGPLQLDLSPEDVRARVDEVLEFAGITKLRDRAPHTLSGGEKKKVCIASVLATNPDVLLLDEPTAGLDPRTQLWLAELLLEIAQVGKTVITATHDLEIMEQISKRAVVVGEDHRVKVDAPSRDVLSNTELLLDANLIHRHMHHHGAIQHQHLHVHQEEHSHNHV
jgi:cobalt/nickel transport system ATP-binding protein